MPSVEFVLTATPAIAKATAIDALVGQRFRVTWHDDWTATAVRSKAANTVAGAMAGHLRIDLRLISGEKGRCVLRLDPHPSGWMARATGTRRARTDLAQLWAHLTRSFDAGGALVEVRGAPEARP